MSEESGVGGYSPFALSPSARPPTGAEIHVQVRVPPPSQITGELARASDSTSVPLAEPAEATSEASVTAQPAVQDSTIDTSSAQDPTIDTSSAQDSTIDTSSAQDPTIDTSSQDSIFRQSAGPIERLASRPDQGEKNASLPLPSRNVSGPDAPAIPAPVFDPIFTVEQPPRRRKLALIAGSALVGLVVLVVAILGLRLLGARKAEQSADRSAAQASATAASSTGSEANTASSAASAEAPLASVTSTPEAPAPVASAGSEAPAPAASGSSGAHTKSGAAPKPFDRNAARAALDALVPKLGACKLAKGSAWSVKVTFAPDGRVTSAAPLGKHGGSAQGTCVATQLKKGSVAPFSGKPTAYVHNFVAPSK